MIGNENDNPRIVLVVDDEPIVRQYVRVLLEREYFQVIEASNGLEAWDTVRNFVDPLALVITDVRMPQMTGIEFADSVKKEFPALPLVFISGESAPAGVPMDSFVEKPFTPTELLEAVHHTLNGKQHSYGS